MKYNEWELYCEIMIMIQSTLLLWKHWNKKTMMGRNTYYDMSTKLAHTAISIVGMSGKRLMTAMYVLVFMS